MNRVGPVCCDEPAKTRLRVDMIKCRRVHIVTCRCGPVRMNVNEDKLEWKNADNVVSTINGAKSIIPMRSDPYQ